MRKTKLRAWDKDNKKMIKWEDLKFEKDENEGEICFYEKIDECEYDGGLDVELMQYTGLKDKNGKEIYEGDILAPDKTCRSSSRYIIEWNDKHCCFTSIEGGINNFIGDIDEEIKFNLISNMKLNICEVIGNIYENPKLLNS